MKKIAVCLSGEMRLFEKEEIYQSLNKFLYPHNPDIFISTWSHLGYSMNHSYIDPMISKNVESSLETRIVKVYQNIKNINIEDYNSWIKNMSTETYKKIYSDNFQPATVNSYTQIYKFWDSIRLKKQYEISNGFTYDIVIRMRPDNLLVDNLDFDISPSTIYHINLPGIAFYPNRIYDIFFYGDSNSMDLLSESYTDFLTLLEHQFNNGLCKRDCCRILFLQSQIKSLNVVSTKNRPTDTYRHSSLEEYLKNFIIWDK